MVHFGIQFIASVVCGLVTCNVHNTEQRHIHFIDKKLIVIYMFLT